MREDVVPRIGSKRHRFEVIPHEKCASCGERIFDLEASKLFDKVLLARRRRRVA